MGGWTLRNGAKIIFFWLDNKTFYFSWPRQMAKTKNKIFINIHLFLQHHYNAAIKLPSYWYASQWFSSNIIIYQLTDPQTEAFSFHQLLHQKKKLLDNETELLVSAKLIVVNFISNVITIAKRLLDLPAENKLKVKQTYFVKFLNPFKNIFTVN